MLKNLYNLLIEILDSNKSGKENIISFERR